MKKIVLIISGILLTLAIVYLLAMAMLPGNYKVERDIIINKPVEQIYPYVADFNSWKHWSPWYEQEPTADYQFGGTPGETGHYMKWLGDIVGSGKLEITKAIRNKSIQQNLEFYEPFEAKSIDYFRFEAKGSTTRVVWGMKGELPYLFRFAGLTIESDIAPDYEKGLSNLKKLAEWKPTPKDLELRVD